MSTVWTREFAQSEGVDFISRIVKYRYGDKYEISVSYDDGIPSIDVIIVGGGETLIESFAITVIDRARAEYPGGVSTYVNNIIDEDIKDRSK